MKNFARLPKFIRHSGSSRCSVSNRRQYSADLEQGGLEIPYKTNFSTSISVEKEKAETVIAAVSNFGGENCGKSMQFCQICLNFQPLNYTLHCMYC